MMVGGGFRRQTSVGGMNYWFGIVFVGDCVFGLGVLQFRCLKVTWRARLSKCSGCGNLGAKFCFGIGTWRCRLGQRSNQPH